MQGLLGSGGMAVRGARLPELQMNVADLIDQKSILEFTAKYGRYPVSVEFQKI